MSNAEYVKGIKEFRIKFCWAQSFPVDIILDGKIVTLPEIAGRTRKISFYGNETEGIPEVLKRLKGTNPRVISNINSIITCQR